MKPFLRLLLLVPLLLLSAAIAQAQVTVPDDYPTIQAALASGAPVIYVRDGTYVENLTIDRSVTLRSRPPASSFEIESNPVLAGSVTFQTPATSAEATLQGFHVQGGISIQAGMIPDMVINLTQNRIDGGVTQTTSTACYIRVRGNTIFGEVLLNGYDVDFTNNTVSGGGLTMNYEGYSRVAANFMVDSPVSAIDVNANDGGGVITRNTVERPATGIVLRESSGANVDQNVVRSASGDAYVATVSGPGGTGTFSDNSAFDSGGDGFHLGGVGYTVSGNRAEHSNGDGFEVNAVAQFDGNVSLQSGGDGAHVTSGLSVTGNVIGRSGASGLVVETVLSKLEANTSYLNALNGYVLGSDGASSIGHNIAHGNSGYGLVWTGVTPALECNDWFGNSSGATSGVSPGATDLFVNPLFCDLPADDVNLSASSPLVGTTCGQIGARGVGCASATGVGPRPAGGLSFYAYPQPASGSIRFGGDALTGSGVLRVFDSRGALCWEVALDGSTRDVSWNLRGRSGSPVAPGIYFARLDLGTRTLRQRIVVVR